MSAPSDAFQAALTLLVGAGTWHELRTSLAERGLDRHLSPADVQDLLAAWHSREARRLSDIQLTRELAYWADGGTFEAHLDGWQAVNPAALVEEARERGWLVKDLPSGAMVNPPGSRPLMIRSTGVVVTAARTS